MKTMQHEEAESVTRKGGALRFFDWILAELGLGGPGLGWMLAELGLGVPSVGCVYWVVWASCSCPRVNRL